MVRPVLKNETPIPLLKIEGAERDVSQSPLNLSTNLPRPHSPQPPTHPPTLKNKIIRPLEYALTFRETLDSYILETEKLEKSAQNKATLMKVLFLSFLILGIICAASFFLLPVLGEIAGLLGLSVAATTIAWQVIFLGGGFLAGLSFLPRRFIKGMEEKKMNYHHQVDALRHFAETDNFQVFLENELSGKYKNPEIIVSAIDFAKLYYLLQNLKSKSLDILRVEEELIYAKRLIQPFHEFKGAELRKQKELEEKVNQINKYLQEMKREAHDLENEINDVRGNLANLDRI